MIKVRRKEIFYHVLNPFLFTVIWYRTYGKGQLSERGNPLLLLYGEGTKYLI